MIGARRGRGHGGSGRGVLGGIEGRSGSLRHGASRPRCAKCVRVMAAGAWQSVAKGGFVRLGRSVRASKEILRRGVGCHGGRAGDVVLSRGSVEWRWCKTKTDVGECMLPCGGSGSGAGNARIRHWWRRLEADGKGT